MPNRFSPLFSHEISTKAFSCLLALCFFLTSCATGHQYYDRDQDGTRYYETMKGKTIHVTADGVVFGSDGQQLGEVGKNGADWDLSAYEVQPSYSRCVDLFDWEESVPCWGYGLQIPVFLVAIPAGLAVVGAGLATAFYCGGGCSFSSGNPPSYSKTQARSNQGPARDRGGPYMQGAPSVGK